MRSRTPQLHPWPRAHRKGLLVRAPHLEEAGYGWIPYGAWRPKKKRLAACDEMQGWYEKYMENERQKARRCGGRRTGACARIYRKRGKTLRKRGKAAWKICKKEGRLEEARDIQSAADIPLTLPGPRPGDAPPGASFAPSRPEPDPYTPGLYDDPGSNGTILAPEEPNWLMWGGLAVGAGLVGWWAFRK